LNLTSEGYQKNIFAKNNSKKFSPSLRNRLYSESFLPTLATPLLPLSKATDGSFAELGVDKDC